MSIKVLALDLERTLISDARTALPRPGLYDFLIFCDENFTRLALFTTVEKPDAFDALEQLESNGHVPSSFLDRLEYVDWYGEHKDLMLVPETKLGEAMLIDDDAGWIRPDQKEWWIPITPWDGGDDHELQWIQTLLLSLQSETGNHEQ